MRKPRCEDNKATNKGAWSKQEDQKLADYVKAHGEGCWNSLPKSAGLRRGGKSCRFRWVNYLKPDIKRGDFGPDEEDLIIKLHALLGNRWSLIAGRLPGRTDNEVKNYWNSHIRKKLISKGIDPNNHPLNRILPPLQPYHVVSAGSTSSSTKDADKKTLTTSSADSYRASSAASLLEKVETSGACDLNLDLSITFPSPKVEMEEDDKPKNLESMMMSREVESERGPTLLLFT